MPLFILWFAKLLLISVSFCGRFSYRARRRRIGQSFSSLCFCKLIEISKCTSSEATRLCILPCDIVRCEFLCASKEVDQCVDSKFEYIFPLPLSCSPNVFLESS